MVVILMYLFQITLTFLLKEWYSYFILMKLSITIDVKTGLVTRHKNKNILHLYLILGMNRNTIYFLCFP
jgi:hypothetical protein